MEASYSPTRLMGRFMNRYFPKLYHSLRLAKIFGIAMHLHKFSGEQILRFCDSVMKDIDEALVYFEKQNDKSGQANIILTRAFLFVLRAPYENDARCFQAYTQALVDADIAERTFRDQAMDQEIAMSRLLFGFAMLGVLGHPGDKQNTANLQLALSKANQAADYFQRKAKDATGRLELAWALSIRGVLWAHAHHHVERQNKVEMLVKALAIFGSARSAILANPQLLVKTPPFSHHLIRLDWAFVRVAADLASCHSMNLHPVSYR